jgi:hypothetical protein
MKIFCKRLKYFNEKNCFFKLSNIIVVCNLLVISSLGKFEFKFKLSFSFSFSLNLFNFSLLLIFIFSLFSFDLLISSLVALLIKKFE